MQLPTRNITDLNEVAYCGTPPTIETIAMAWNFDPILLVAFVITGYFIFKYATSPAMAWSAYGLAFLIFVTPLCSLSSALFSARVIHHVILVAGIAPLIIKAFPPIRMKYNLSVGFFFMLHVVTLWLWHAPMPYVWALSSVVGYWFMQISLFLSAAALWHLIFEKNRGTSIVILLGTVAQMGLLGALIVFAPNALYSVHAGTTEPWGLSQIEDQQLAGLIMWLPATLPYFIFAILLGRHYLQEEQKA